MDELELLRALAANAQGEGEPVIDVTARVIERIARQPRRRADTRLSVLLPGACACLLLAIAFVVTESFRSSSDTLEAFAEAAIGSTGPEAVRKVFQP
jgi:hypothetical protein